MTEILSPFSTATHQYPETTMGKEKLLLFRNFIVITIVLQINLVYNNQNLRTY